MAAHLEGGLALLIGELGGFPLLLSLLWLGALLLLRNRIFPDLVVHLLEKQGIFSPTQHVQREQAEVLHITEITSSKVFHPSEITRSRVLHPSEIAKSNAQCYPSWPCVCRQMLQISGHTPKYFQLHAESEDNELLSIQCLNNGAVRVGAHRFVQLLDVFGLDLSLDPLGEVRLVLFGRLLLHLLHVLRHMAAHDVLAQHLRVQLLVLAAVAHKPLVAVRDVQPAVQRALSVAPSCHMSRM